MIKLNCGVVRHNWAESNTRIYFHKVHTQNHQKFNVYPGIFGDSLIGSFFFLDWFFFFPGYLTAEMYLNLIQNAIDPSLTIMMLTLNRY